MQFHRYITLTPTKNEAWIIRHFVSAAKMWAHDIIIADQGSSDGTLQAIQNISGVHSLVNDSPVFDEDHRQKLLLRKARTVEGKRVLIALDADEALSANCLSSSDWGRIQAAAPGTLLRFRWANILPGFQRAWVPAEHRVFGFVDDGSEHRGRRIHSPRVPEPDGAPVLDLNEIVVLHFQYVLWERMASKQRWYQAWEHAKHVEKGPLRIFREYNHMFGSWEQSEIQQVRPEWLEAYDKAGIDFKALKAEEITWWDAEILRMLGEYGPDHFRRIAIWDVNWNKLAAKSGLSGVDFSDPRSGFQKTAHRLLAITQKDRSSWGARALEALLRRVGW